MRPSDQKFQDPEMQKMWNQVKAVLSNVSQDNFKAEVIEGTTNSSADTKSLFKHTLSTIPSMWLALEGDVYVPKKGLSPSEIDVRSRLTGQQFTILVIR